MSSVKWTIEGRGVTYSKIAEYVSIPKLAFLFVATLSDENRKHFENQIREEAGLERFDKTEFINDLGLDGEIILGILEFEFDNQLRDIFPAVDSRKILTACDDGADEFYIYYPKKFPWDVDASDPKTEEEFDEHFVRYLQSFCTDEMTSELAKSLIEDISETGAQ